MKRQETTKGLSGDPKSMVFGVVMVVGVSLVSIFGVRLSLSMLDYHRREAIQAVQQDQERIKAEYHSYQQALSHGLAKTDTDADDGKTVEDDTNVSQTDADTGDSDVIQTVTHPKSEETVPDVPDKISGSSPEITEQPWYTVYPQIQVTDMGLFYLIQPGDTLLGIASQFGFTVTELASYNSISNPGQIYVGEQIWFPNEGPMDIGDPSVGLG